MTPAQKAAETRQNRTEKRKAAHAQNLRDNEIVKDALRVICENVNTKPADRLKAVELLLKMNEVI